MKTIIIVLIMTCLSVIKVSAQTDNIWQVTSTYLIDRGEIAPDQNVLPVKSKNGTKISFYLSQDNQAILDPKYTIPLQDTLSIYKFSGLSPHATRYLLFVKNGVWKIINVAESLPSVMAQGIALCEILNLSPEDEYYIFQEILKNYQFNQSRKNGAPIVPHK